MAGIHADRGDKSHRIVSGEVPRPGLQVLTNNLDRGIIIAVEDEAGEKECGWYCNAWHTIRLTYSYDGKPLTGTTIMNCDRLTTRSPR